MAHGGNDEKQGDRKVGVRGPCTRMLVPQEALMVQICSPTDNECNIWLHSNCIAGLEQDYVIRDENDSTIDKRV